MSKQNATRRPMLTSPSLVATPLCSKSPAPTSITIAGPVSTSQPCCQGSPCHIPAGREPHSIPIETRQRLTANRPIDNAPPISIDTTQVLCAEHCRYGATDFPTPICATSLHHNFPGADHPSEFER